MTTNEKYEQLKKDYARLAETNNELVREVGRLSKSSARFKMQTIDFGDYKKTAMVRV